MLMRVRVWRTAASSTNGPRVCSSPRSARRRRLKKLFGPVIVTSIVEVGTGRTWVMRLVKPGTMLVAGPGTVFWVWLPV